MMSVGRSGEKLLVAVTLGLTVLLVACGGGGGGGSPPPPPPPPPITVTVSPSSASVPAGGTAQFTASVTGTSNTAVTWSVNGVTGGNSTLGTITTSGLYTAPGAMPSGPPPPIVKRTVSVAAGTTAPPTDIAVQQFTAPNIVTVTATSQADPSRSASATVTIATLIVRALGVATTAGSTGAAVSRSSMPTARLLLVGQGIVQGTSYEITGSGVQVVQPSATDFVTTTDGTPAVRLTVVISPLASLGPRNLIVTNSVGELSAFVGGLLITP